LSRLACFLKKNYHSNIKDFLDFKFVLYSAEGPRGLSHLDLWIPTLIESNINFVVFLRSLRLFNSATKKYSNVSFILVNSKNKVDFFLKKIKNAKVVLYSSNIGYNIDLVDNNNLKHVFIGHGDSDKTASAHKFFRIYDEIWVAGEAHIDRFKSLNINLNGLNFIKVGRPNLEKTLNKCEDKKYQNLKNQINILYLSTWEGAFIEQDYTSIYILKNILTKFNEEKNIDKFHMKFHPFVGKRDKKLNNYVTELLNLKLESINTEIMKNISINNLLNHNYNVFICDISAVITEVLICNKPIFVYIPNDKNIKTSKSKMEYKDYTYIFSSTEELIEKFNKIIIEGNDYLKSKREEALEYILGKNETLNKVFYKVLESSVS